MRRLAGVATAVGVSWVLAGCGGGAAPTAASNALPPAPPAAVVPIAPAPVTAQPSVSPLPSAPTAVATPFVVAMPTTTAEAAPTSVITAEPTRVARPAPMPTRPASATRPRRPAAPVAKPKARVPAHTDNAELVTARPGMRNPKPTEWQHAEVLGERKLRVHFTSGVAPCEVLDSVRVDYRPDTVVVTLYTGSDPKQTDRVCAAVAQEQAVDVRLAKPLDGRTIIDGAKVSVAPPAGAPGQPTTGAVEVRPTPGATDTRATAWDRAEEIGERTVRIYFTAGTAPCMVLDRVRVAYAADRVTITLITGRGKAAAGQACAMALRPAYVDVRLDEPLAGRAIVDGA